MSTLRGESNLGPAASQLDPEERNSIEQAQHPALHVAQRMSQCLQQARRQRLITDVIQVSLDANVQLLKDYVGGCERIRKTPAAVRVCGSSSACARYLLRYTPFALVETFGWFTILDVLFVAYTFFGIEEIGVEIEGPFGDDANDLPMQSFCETIHNNVYALTGVTHPQREIMPEGL